MSSSLRCRVTGCDLDECGICKRCNDDRQASHSWVEEARRKPCYKRMACERCSEVKESPDHAWEPGPSVPGQEISLHCGRCGLKI